jgi:hypothetical protein
VRPFDNNRAPLLHVHAGRLMSRAMAGSDTRQPRLAQSSKRVNSATWLPIVLAGLLLAACAGQPTPTPTPSGRGWRCTFAGTGATLAFEGKRLNFTCPRVGDRELGLIGDVVHTEQGWELERVTFARTDKGFELLSSEWVPISALIVVD